MLISSHTLRQFIDLFEQIPISTRDGFVSAFGSLEPRVFLLTGATDVELRCFTHEVISTIRREYGTVYRTQVSLGADYFEKLKQGLSPVPSPHLVLVTEAYSIDPDYLLNLLRTVERTHYSTRFFLLFPSDKDSHSDFLMRLMRWYPIMSFHLDFSKNCIALPVA